MRYSHQRELIFSDVRSRNTCATAQTVFDAVKKRCSTLSFATVYRNLNQLEKIGQLRRISIVGSPDYYTADTQSHVYFCCRHCGSMVGLSAPALPLDSITKALEDAGLYPEDDNYNLTVSGTCKSCRTKEAHA